MVNKTTGALQQRLRLNVDALTAFSGVLQIMKHYRLAYTQESGIRTRPAKVKEKETQLQQQGQQQGKGKERIGFRVGKEKEERKEAPSKDSKEKEKERLAKEMTKAEDVCVNVGPSFTGVRIALRTSKEQRLKEQVKHKNRTNKTKR